MTETGWKEVKAKEGDILYELPELTEELGFVMTLATFYEARVFAEANHLTLIKEARFLGDPTRLDYTGGEWIFTSDGWRNVLPISPFAFAHGGRGKSH